MAITPQLNKKVFILSISVNIILSSFFFAYIIKRGGISYISKKFFPDEAQAHNSLKLKNKKYYLDKKSLFEILEIEKDDVVFIGDSITEGCDWNELFHDIRIKNRGIGGDTTQDIYERLDHILAYHPTKVFIMIGILDLGNNKILSKLIRNYKKIFDRISKESPDTKVYVQSILPVNNDINTYERRKNTEIIKANKQIEILAAEYGATYIDLFPCFLSANNMLDEKYTNDGLHLTGKGYLLWKSQIEQYVIE